MLARYASALARGSRRRGHAWSFYDRLVGCKTPIARKMRAARPLLRVFCPLAEDARGNPLHLVFTLQFHFFQLNFFQEIFGIQVGRLGNSLKLCIVLPVLLCQTLILGVCQKKYVPRCPLRASHAFLLTTLWMGCEYRMRRQYHLGFPRQEATRSISVLGCAYRVKSVPASAGIKLLRAGRPRPYL